MNSCDLGDLEIVDAVLGYKLVVVVAVVVAVAVAAADVGPESADMDMQKAVVVDCFDVTQHVESEMNSWQEH